MTNFGNLVISAENIDPKQKEMLIRENESLILRTASSVSHRYITKSDDEWSIALYAFSRAIDSYDKSRGEFPAFAKLLIKRDLIDYFRTEQKHQTIAVAPHVLEGNAEPEEDAAGVYLSVVKASKEKTDQSLQEEILAANELLKTYGFRFFDLTECSPQQDKTKAECASAICCLFAEPSLMDKLKTKKKLPIRQLAEKSKVSKKILDRYRKYIIMAVLILEGDFPHIADYLKYVKEYHPE